MPVITFMFYHGHKDPKWKESLQEEDFPDILPKIPIKTRRSMLNYKMRVVSTRDPKIRKVFHKTGSQIGGVLKLFSEIKSLKNPSVEKVKSIVEDDFKGVLKGLNKIKKQEIIAGLVEYLTDMANLKANVWKRAEKQLIENKILEKGGIMTVKEIFKEKGIWEGERKGRKEGRKEVALKMLEKKTKVSFISEVTGLSEKQIKTLKKKS